MDNQKNTAQEKQSSVREFLDKPEIDSIKNEFFAVLFKNNLSIRQAKDILKDVIDELDECRPWDHSIKEISKV